MTAGSLITGHGCTVAIDDIGVNMRWMRRGWKMVPVVAVAVVDARSTKFIVEEDR